jgi:colanic acid biosynthesis glycosyl transferase WcaI
MRICIVNEFFYPDSTGGTGTVLSDLVRSLRESVGDLEIDVITSHNLYREAGVKLAAQEDWNGVSIYRLATPRPNGLPTPLRLVVNLLFCLLALGKLARLERYDALLIGTAPPMLAMSAQALQWLNGTPFIYIVYDLEPDRSVTMKMLSANHPFVRLFRNRQKRWLHSAAKVIVIGRCMREYLNAFYSLPENKVEVIPIGSDPNEIVPVPRATRFRAEHGLEGFIVLYSGNFGRYHDFDTVLDAAKSLAEGTTNIQFVLVGGGAQKEHIAQRITGENIGNVHLFDFVSKEAYNDLLASADVSLVTLEPGMEGLCVPSKFYSILASGRPTIAAVSPTSEVARVIDEAYCGVHLKQGNVAQLVNILTFLSANPMEVETMGRNARLVLEEKYSTQHIARQYYTVFQDVAQFPKERASLTVRPTAELDSSTK